jgi:hypothetical protein
MLGSGEFWTSSLNRCHTSGIGVGAASSACGWSPNIRNGKILPVLAAAGLRAVAAGLDRLRPLGQASPDRATTATACMWSGCGGSRFDVLDLRDVTLVGQDWFARVIAANTGLPTGDAVQERPAWLAVQQQDRLTARRACLNVGHLHAADLGVARPATKVGELFEPVIWRPQYPHSPILALKQS